MLQIFCHSSRIACPLRVNLSCKNTHFNRKFILECVWQPPGRSPGLETNGERIGGWLSTLVVHDDFVQYGLQYILAPKTNPKRLGFCPQCRNLYRGREMSEQWASPLYNSRLCDPQCV